MKRAAEKTSTVQCQECGGDLPDYGDHRSMNRANAEPLVRYIADDAGSFRKPAGLPCDNSTDRDWLIGWNQPGFNPVFVRVRSYLPGVHLDETEATELATDGLDEMYDFFHGVPRAPDFILSPLGG